MKVQFLYTVFAITLMTFLFIGCRKDFKPEKRFSLTEELRLSKEPVNTPEEKDWEKVKKNVKTFYGPSENNEKYYNGSFLYSRQVEEEYFKRVSNSTSSFLHKYPHSKHYYAALELYFSYLDEPRNLSSKMSKEKRAFLTQERDNSLRYQQYRALPFDIEARDKRLREGDSLANKFLQSNAPTDQKASIELGVLSRDMRIARELLQNLNFKKKKREKNFWILFGRYYWGSFVDRIDKLLYKYPDYPEWPNQINGFIRVFTLSDSSPEIKELLWKHFEEVTDRPELFEKHPAILKTHQKAKKNLKALEELKTFDETQPLQMQMTDMDGQRINLENYRGKVVMLDFWDLRCAPCIQEMPHVQALYEKYKDQGFEVIGICSAGDKSRERIQEITERQGATWPQVLDTSKDAKISYHSLYNIERLPTVWLLNKNGIIVDKNARGNRLEPLIQKLLQSN